MKEHVRPVFATTTIRNASSRGLGLILGLLVGGVVKLVIDPLAAPNDFS